MNNLNLNIFKSTRTGTIVAEIGAMPFRHEFKKDQQEGKTAEDMAEEILNVMEFDRAKVKKRLMALITDAKK